MYKTIKHPQFDVTYVIGHVDGRSTNFMNTGFALAGILRPGENLCEWMLRKDAKKKEMNKIVKNEKLFKQWLKI